MSFRITREITQWNSWLKFIEFKFWKKSWNRLGKFNGQFWWAEIYWNLCLHLKHFHELYGSLKVKIESLKRYQNREKFVKSENHSIWKENIHETYFDTWCNFTNYFRVWKFQEKSAHKIVNLWGSEKLSNDNEKSKDRQNRENLLYNFNIFYEF